jgi:hypothetical protein
VPSACDRVTPVDPFDLPEWLGVDEVTWTAVSRVRGVHLVSGLLSAGAQSLPCDLLAADQAYPAPVLAEPWRRAAHQSWTLGQVLLVERDGRLTLASPGREFTADGALEVLARLAKAVGVEADRFVAVLRL